jgi:hypothetical protein
MKICPGVNPSKLCFLIFAVKLSHFVIEENNALIIKCSSLLAKNETKCLFMQEQFGRLNFMYEGNNYTGFLVVQNVKYFFEGMKQKQF